MFFSGTQNKSLFINHYQDDDLFSPQDTEGGAGTSCSVGFCTKSGQNNVNQVTKNVVTSANLRLFAALQGRPPAGCPPCQCASCVFCLPSAFPIACACARC